MPNSKIDWFLFSTFLLYLNIQSALYIAFVHYTNVKKTQIEPAVYYQCENQATSIQFPWYVVQYNNFLNEA